MANSTDTRTKADRAALSQIWGGLGRELKELPAKFFYDHRGSELFEQITGLPEYYPTRCERYILATWMPSLVAECAPGTIVELGAGSGEKTRILLRALESLPGRRAYVPVDVSRKFLHQAAEQLRAEFARIDVVPVVGDLEHGWVLPEDLPHPHLLIFLGGTIGNFALEDAVELLHRIRVSMRPEDRFLMGADLRKERAVIEAAYNDEQGVTADFNANMLRALNRTYGTTFDLDSFVHRAFYNERNHRIEMHLVCRRTHEVHVPGHGSVRLAAGESIRTEISCKYDRTSLSSMLEAAGMELVELRTDPDSCFAVVEGAPA